MRLGDFDSLTFDCYGTLIDWESGIVAAFQPWLESAGNRATDDEILAAFSSHEPRQQQATPDMLYPRILTRVHAAMATAFGVGSTDEAARAFGASVKDWPAFADSTAALKALQRHYRLVILSNVDRESFAASNRKLGVDFDHVYTAQDIGSYKPDPANFSYMIEALARDGIDKGRVLHTAESLYHDHLPARRAGLATCWIHRRHDRGGFGATHPPAEEVTPDFRFESLAAMAAAREAEEG